jgi:ADP-heptose:LPS heptosyltransferase
MGIGDEIMASGHARVVHRETGKKVKIVGLDKRQRWSEMWEGLPWIAQPKERGDFAVIQNGPQCRPYVQYPFTREIGQRFTDWRARDHVGSIAFTQRELEWTLKETTGLGEFVIIEPNLSPKANPNKQWGPGKWQALADLLIAEGHKVLQIGSNGLHLLRGARYVFTPNFRFGAAVLARARAAILPEGGLHHAAGVLRIPAVVLFGGMISPDVTGYEWHTNLADTGTGSPCGRWKPCRHCQRIWARLDPETVLHSFHTLLEGTQCRASA